MKFSTVTGTALPDCACAPPIAINVKVNEYIRRFIFIGQPSSRYGRRWQVGRPTGLSDAVLIGRTRYARFAGMQTQATPVCRLPERAAMSLVGPRLPRSGGPVWVGLLGSTGRA